MDPGAKQQSGEVTFHSLKQAGTRLGKPVVRNKRQAGFLEDQKNTDNQVPKRWYVLHARIHEQRSGNESLWSGGLTSHADWLTSCRCIRSANAVQVVRGGKTREAGQQQRQVQLDRGNRRHDSGVVQVEGKHTGQTGSCDEFSNMHLNFP